MTLCRVYGGNKMTNESSLEVIIEWDCKVPFGDPTIEFYKLTINVTNSPEKFKEQYSGELRGVDASEGFVAGLMRSVEIKRYKNKSLKTDNGDNGSVEIQIGNELEEPDSEIRGSKTFILPFSSEKGYAVSIYEYYGLLDKLSRLEEKHFLLPRNETVNDNDYCSFYGSSGGMWTRSNYLRGDFVETIEQTIYDMQHGSPTNYHWTNVPRMWCLKLQREIDPEFDKLVKKKVELNDKEFYDLACKTSDNPSKKRVRELIRILEECAAPVREYKQERGIIRL